MSHFSSMLIFVKSLIIQLTTLDMSNRDIYDSNSLIPTKKKKIPFLIKQNSIKYIFYLRK